jgi:carboxypeptidase PM20D1
VYRFIPMRVKSEDMPRIHGINERIRVENMAEIVRFYAQLIRNAAS